MNIKKILIVVACVMGFTTITYALVYVQPFNRISYKINSIENTGQDQYLQSNFPITGFDGICYGVTYGNVSALAVSKQSSGAWNSFLVRAQSGMIPNLTIDDGSGVCNNYAEGSCSLGTPTQSSYSCEFNQESAHRDCQGVCHVAHCARQTGNGC